jgi:cell wall-associated NlpC family hydrolase
MGGFSPLRENLCMSPIAPVSRQTYVPFRGELSETNGLQLGHRGVKVLEMQTMLQAAGFDPGPLDGKFGPRTLAALRAYQGATGSSVDGSMELPEFKRLQGNYEKITGSSFEEQRRGFSRTGQFQGADENFTVQISGAQGPGTAAEMVRRALEQRGDRYRFGAEVNLNDQNPNTFDCSELVEWAVHQAGGRITDGSQAQRAATQRISVQEAARIPGALLFNGHHVAISLGDGVHTIEAMGTRQGVTIGRISPGRFEDGGLVRGLRY